MSNGLVNQTREGLPLFSSNRERLGNNRIPSRNQGRRPESCLVNDIACEELTQILRWENEGGPARPPEMAKTENEQSAELKKYGITPVQLTVFDWGGYRYSNAKDAIAEAKRPPKQP